MSGHGPDSETFDKAVNAVLAPAKIEGGLAFMFETRLVIRPTQFALATPSLQAGYDEAWSGLTRSFAVAEVRETLI